MTGNPERDLEKAIIKKVQSLRSIYIGLTDHRQAMTELKFRLAYGLEQGRIPTTNSHSAARLTTVTAESGAGKTTLIHNFIDDARRNPEVHQNTIVFLALPSPCTIKTMTTVFLEALGDPLAHKVSTTAANNTLRIVRRIHELGVKMIIIDEFQHLLDSDRNAVRLETTDWLKSMLDKTGAEIVCVGLPSTSHVVSSNAQLQRRTSANISISALKWDGGKQSQEFRIVLEELEKAMGFDAPFILSQPTYARAIHHVTQGLIGRVINLLERAIREAMMRSGMLSRITWEDLGKASITLDPTQNNPFTSANLVTDNGTPSNDRVVSGRAGPRAAKSA